MESAVTDFLLNKGWTGFLVILLLSVIFWLAKQLDKKDQKIDERDKYIRESDKENLSVMKDLTNVVSMVHAEMDKLPSNLAEKLSMVLSPLESKIDSVKDRINENRKGS